MSDTSANKILVPIGFSEQSLIALDEAVIFAKAMNAEITLLSVVEDHGLFARLFSSDESEKQVKEQTKQKLEEVAADLRKAHGLQVVTMVAKGTVYDEVSRVAELISATLVIMGTNGKPSNFRKRFIGSNAYRVVGMVEPPVITIQGIRKIDKIDTIIFPIVIDKNSKEKVGPALHFARLFNANIKLVSVATVKSEEPTLKANLKQVSKFIASKGIVCSAELIKPDSDKSVVNNVLDFSYKNNGDLIMIIEDESATFADVFLGSDSQQVIYHSEIPVMSITPSKKQFESVFTL